ncbi:MAG: GAF domain-containing protein [Thermodesulfobacteriota bacterium]|nr:GAF domain-containing protein [Thermodesulfobacteriota bacterium]
MASRRQPRKWTFRHLYTVIFGLTSILPLLLFLFVVEHYGIVQEPKVALLLGTSLVIALIGFVFSLRIVRQVKTLAQGFIKVKRGDLTHLGEGATTSDVSEMFHIADSFNETLAQLRAHTAELESLSGKFNALSELARMVSKIPNTPKVLQAVLHRTMAALNATAGSVMLLDDETQTLKVLCAEGLDESVVTETILKLGERIAGKVATSGEAVVVEDVEQDPRLQIANNPKYESTSFICMPLRARGKVTGVLNLSKRGNRQAFSRSDLTFLTSLLGHVGFAVENARLIEEAKEAARKLREVVNNQSLKLDKVRRQVENSTRLLQQAQKMEAIGTLAGGIAHDFNNLLSIILGNVSMAKEDHNQDDGISDFLSQAEEASLRAKELTHQLITFSRGGVPVRKRASIIALLEESASLALAGSDAKCDFSIAEDLWAIEYDESQMRHVIMHLVTNAREAMSDRGTIRLSARNLIITGDEMDQTLPIQPGKYVKICVQDQGVGIPEEDLPRIFDPYFSTKERGCQKGMGLGLATAYSIINKHDGHIAVASKPAVGTTCNCYLPASDGETASKRRAEKKGHATRGKVLVMEDERMLRTLAGQMLNRLGYEAELVEEGDEAIVRYKEAMDSGDPFDGVILDLSVRDGMGGKEAIRKLKEMDPDIKAIVSSGYSDDPVMTDWRKYGFGGAMFKPYRQEDLTMALRRLLAK